MEIVEAPQPERGLVIEISAERGKRGKRCDPSLREDKPNAMNEVMIPVVT